MPRIPRSALPDGIYHVTARGTGGIAIVKDELYLAALVRLLASTGDTLDWTWHAYCL